MPEILIFEINDALTELTDITDVHRSIFMNVQILCRLRHFNPVRRLLLCIFFRVLVNELDVYEIAVEQHCLIDQRPGLFLRQWCIEGSQDVVKRQTVLFIRAEVEAVLNLARQHDFLRLLFTIWWIHYVFLVYLFLLLLLLVIQQFYFLHFFHFYFLLFFTFFDVKHERSQVFRFTWSFLFINQGSNFLLITHKNKTLNQPFVLCCFCCCCVQIDFFLFPSTIRFVIEFPLTLFTMLSQLRYFQWLFLIEQIIFLISRTIFGNQ